MDGTSLERDIALGIAMAARAEQIAGPTLDCLISGMIGETERLQLQQASVDLANASTHCRYAMDSFAAASRAVGAFTRGRK